MPRIISLPKRSTEAFNKHRPANALLRAQVAHLHKALVKPGGGKESYLRLDPNKVIKFVAGGSDGRTWYGAGPQNGEDGLVLPCPVPAGHIEARAETDRILEILAPEQAAQPR